MQGQDLGCQLLGVVVPLLTTLPALRTERANTAAIVNALATLRPLQINSPPSQQDFITMQNYANTLRNNLMAAVNNEQTVFSTISQGLLFQIVLGAASQPAGLGGNNLLIPLVLVMALGGSFGA